MRKSARVHQGRKRPYPRRWLLVALGIGLPALLVRAVAMRAFATDGFFRPLYWLHDFVWLPVYGHLWTASFPYTLIWATPLAVGLALMLTECLTPLGVHPLHRMFVRAAIRRRRPAASPLRAVASGTENRRWLSPPAPAPQIAEGYSVLVAQEMRQRAWSVLRENLADSGLPQSPGAEPLVRATAWWIARDPTDPRGLLAALEAVAAVPGAAGEGVADLLAACIAPARGLPDVGAHALRDGLDLLSRHLGAAEAQIAVESRVRTLDAHLIRGDGAGVDPIALAADAVTVGGIGLRHPMRQSRVWFEVAASIRLGASRGAAPAAATAMAMALVDYELWALLAERADRSVPRGSLLDAPEDGLDRAEAFAWDGAAK